MEPIDYSIEQQPNDPFAGKVYAGFWWRVLAYIIDGIILWIVQAIIFFFLRMAGINLELTEAQTQALTERLIEDRDFLAFYGDIFILQKEAFIFTYTLRWLYFALMECSPKRGTLGKMALGITVTDMHGQRISFLRATARYFSGFLSSIILCVGYMMAGFTEKKQALHDMIAGTLVMKKE